MVSFMDASQGYGSSTQNVDAFPAASPKVVVISHEAASFSGDQPIMKPRNFFLLTGTLVLFAIVLLPICDALRLMNDPSFVFFVGRYWPGQIVGYCFFAWGLYVTMVLTFFKCAREDGKTAVSFFMIAAIMLTLVGLGMLLLAGPLMRETQVAYNDIFMNCQFSPRTRRLYEYATVLHGVRASPGCVDQDSIRSCDGYADANPYTGLLQALETKYQCSGFCFGNATMAAAAAAVAIIPSPGGAVTTTLPASKLFSTAGRPGLVQALQRAASKRAATLSADALPLSLLQLSEGQDPFAIADDSVTSTDASDASVTTTDAPGPNLGEQGMSPPTLFSNELYKSSCDGMAARDLRFQGMEAARLLFWEGSIILFSVVVCGLMKICTLCTSPSVSKGSKRSPEAIIVM